MRRLGTLGLILALGACSGGYTQEEVDALMAEAVESAVEDAQDDFVSEAEAQAQTGAAAKQASLVAAVDECQPVEFAYVTVDEGGLFMQGEGNESTGTSYEKILCVLTALEIPSTVISRIDNTNSTMGLVEGAWGIYEAEWSYHPDNGLAIHIQVTS